MSYIEVDEAKAYIGGISGASDNALLQSLIDAAQVFIEGETNRIFDADTDSTRKFGMQDVDGPALVIDRDLADITSITNGDEDVLTTSEYVTVPINATPYYEIKLRQFSNLFWTYTTNPEDEIEIAGKWGYSTTPPADILQACKDIVKTVYRSRDANTDAGRTIITGGVVITPADVDKMTMKTLGRYVRR